MALVTIWWVKFNSVYAPNSVRVEVDDDVKHYAIYINDELYEYCPLQATEEEANMRLDEIMDELWIDGEKGIIYKRAY